MIIKNILKFVAFISVIGVSFSSFAQVIGDGPTIPIVEENDTKVKTKERLKVALSGYEYFPSRKDLDSLGAETEIFNLLEKMVDDNTLRPSLRIRAIDAMGHYHSSESARFLKLQIETLPKGDKVSKRTQKRIQTHAITSYAKSTQNLGLTYLEVLARSKNMDIKLSAIYGIAKHGGKAGMAILRKLRKIEKNVLVLRVYRKFLDN